jgi:lipopolysaccharide/colanic/teichoic acid biosynthesis glycosyltransferase
MVSGGLGATDGGSNDARATRTRVLGIPASGAPREVARYPAHVRRRLLVKPGLTGPWPVSGRIGLSWRGSVRLDRADAVSWSFVRDVVIIWRTFAAVIGRRDAY